MKGKKYDRRRSRPRRARGHGSAIQGGFALDCFRRLTGKPEMPATFAQAQSLAARFPCQLRAVQDFRQKAQRRLLAFPSGLLVLSYPASEE